MGLEDSELDEQGEHEKANARIIRLLVYSIAQFTTSILLP